MEARDLLRERPRVFELALRIRHPSIDPATISRELRLKAEHSFKAGEPRESSSGIAATAVHAESYWLATLDPGEMEQQLGMALAYGTTHFLRAHADFLRRVQTEGGDVALIIEVPAGAVQSFTLTPQVAKVLGDYGISVDFEFTND
jgi:hypothetical protein